MGDEYESLYLRTSIDGKIYEKFICLGTSKSACSNDIFNFIKGQFSMWWHKVIGFCSDGASNMQGSRNGVAALVKKDNPGVIVIHCLAHRLELAFRDAIKQACPKLYERSMTLLLGLYYMYRKGPKQKRSLKRSFEALEMTQILPTRVGGTRWLPHLQRAVDVILRGYKAFKFHLDNNSHSTPKAEGLSKILADKSVVVFLLLLNELIKPLIRLSLSLQKSECTLADGMHQIFATKDVLQLYRTKLWQ